MNRLGLLQMIHRQNPASARVYFEKALSIIEDLARADPDYVRFQWDMAQSHYFLGTAQERLGETELADRHFRQCLDLRRPLAERAESKDDPLKIPQINLMVALARCGEHEPAAAIADDLVKVPPQDARIYFQAACGYALCAGAVARGIATDGCSSADSSLRKSYTTRAFQALRDALAHGWKSVVDVQTDPDLDPIRDDPGFPPILDEFRRAAEDEEKQKAAETVARR